MDIASCTERAECEWDDEAPLTNPNEAAAIQALLSPYLLDTTIGKIGLGWGDVFHDSFVDMQDLIQAIQAEREFLIQQQLNLDPLISYCIRTEELKKISPAGTYLLLGSNHQPEKVIKPTDESLLALNNSSFPTMPQRLGSSGIDFPFYAQAQRDVAAYQIAKLLDIDLIPYTELVLVNSNQFYDISDRFSTPEAAVVLQMANVEKQAMQTLSRLERGSSIKVCSIREYIPCALNFTAFRQQTDNTSYHFSPESIDYSEMIIDQFFNPTDIEMAAILIWIIGNRDFDASKILVVPEEATNINNRYKLKLINLGWSFPESYCPIQATLPWDYTQRSLSEQSRQFINNLPVNSIISIMRKWGLDAAIDPLIQRITLLQSLTALTLQEIDTAFSEEIDNISNDNIGQAWLKC